MAQKVSKSLLSPFLKLIHPDALVTAPADVRIANSAALRTINHYFDEIQEGKAAPQQSLRFFLPKGSEYREVTYTLKSFTGSADVDYRSLHLNATIRGLLATTNKHKRSETMLDMESQVADIQHAETVFYTSSILAKTVKHAKLAERRERRMKIESGIEQSLGLADYSSRSDPLIRGIVARSLRHNLEDRLFRSNLPPEHLYFSPKLTAEQHRQAILVLTEELHKGEGGPQAVTQLFSSMFGGELIVPLFVADRYSVTAMPGYLQVPYNLTLTGLLSFWEENRKQVAGRLTDVGVI